jgi:hypothetical protein
MFRVVAFTLGVFLCQPAGSYAQRSTGRPNLQERVLAVVPLTGTGTYSDPRRPLFVPSPKEFGKPGAITGFTWQLTDDGRNAIVEFVARDNASLRHILSDSRVIRSFQKGRDKRETIQLELRKLNVISGLATPLPGADSDSRSHASVVCGRRLAVCGTRDG